MNAVKEVEVKESLTTPIAKLGISLDELCEKADLIQSRCVDYNVSRANNLNLSFSEYTGNLNFIPDGEERAVQSKPVTPYAMSQLCTKLGIPTSYIDKCISNGRLDLAADNINAWISDYNKNLFIRECSGSVRGILSDRYMTLDTPDILKVIGDVVDTSQYSTKGYFMSPERFHARIVQNEMMRINGEDLFAGIQVDSSDVGRSTLMVRFFIFKQVCTNGLCISRANGVLFSQKHIGVSIDSFRSTFRKSIECIPDLVAQTSEFIESSRNSPLPKFTMEEFIERVRLETKLSEEDSKRVIQLVGEKYSPTQWGLINSITEVAQRHTLERRIELEEIAGQMLLRKVA